MEVPLPFATVKADVFELCSWNIPKGVLHQYGLIRRGAVEREVAARRRAEAQPLAGHKEPGAHQAAGPACCGVKCVQRGCSVCVWVPQSPGPLPQPLPKLCCSRARAQPCTGHPCCHLPCRRPGLSSKLPQCRTVNCVANHIQLKCSFPPPPCYLISAIGFLVCFSRCP